MARPLGSGAARASSRRAAGSATSVDRAPRMAPRWRRCRTSRRVSSPSTPGTPAASSSSARLRSARQLEGRRAACRTRKAATWTRSDSASAGGGAVVADLGRGHADELAGVRRVGQDLLVAAHGGVEHHLPGHRGRCGGERLAAEGGAVLQHQQRLAGLFIGAPPGVPRTPPVTWAPAAAAAPPSRGRWPRRARTRSAGRPGRAASRPPAPCRRRPPCRRGGR